MASLKLINAVWEKGVVIRDVNVNSAVYRRDSMRNLIKYGSYGTEGDYGWEIDHIIPKSRGGSDDISNLQPLQWKANRRKANKIAYEDAIF